MGADRLRAHRLGLADEPGHRVVELGRDRLGHGDAGVVGRAFGRRRRRRRRRSRRRARHVLLEHGPLALGERREGRVAAAIEHLVAQAGDRAVDVRLLRRVLEGLEEVGGGLEAAIGIALQRARDHRRHTRRRVGPHARDLRDRHGAHAAQRVVVGHAAEQGAAGEGLVQDDAEREQIGAVIELARAGQALRRHVRELALDHAAGGAMRLHRRAHDAEVDQLDRAGHREHHVLRRDVAVHHAQRLAVDVAQAVGVLERGGHAHTHVHRGLDRQRPIPEHTRADHIEQGVAVDVFERQVVTAVDRAHLVGLRQVRMRTLERDASLGQEELDVLVIAIEVALDALDGDEAVSAVRALLDREEDFRHSADCHAPEQKVLAEPLRQIVHVFQVCAVTRSAARAPLWRRHVRSRGCTLGAQEADSPRGDHLSGSPAGGRPP